MKASIISGLEFKTDVRWLADTAGILGILGAVRNTILDWALRLQEDGITGYGAVSFSEAEKTRAHEGNVYINIGKVDHLSGVVGPVSGAASVISHQETAARSVDLEAVGKFLEEVGKELDKLGLSTEQRRGFEGVAAQVQAELRNSKSSSSKIRKGLASMKGLITSAAANAGGTLIANGALAILNRLLS